MNYTLSKIAIFLGGAAIGSAITWRVLKTQYEQQIQKECEEIEAYWARRAADGYFDNKEEPEKDDENPDKDTRFEINPPVKPAESSIHDYAEILKKQEYVNYASKGETKEKEVADVKRPYVISPEEFDNRRDDGYETETLTFYADGVLADDMDVPIDDIDAVVGKDSLTHFGEYEDDSVFVRNDRLKIDFEILMDPGDYDDSHSAT